MIVTTGYVDIIVDNSPMRTFLAAPKQAGTYPGILCYSDIFQLTDVMLRACVRLAGYGFVAAASEIYHRSEPPGRAIPFDDAGRDRGLADAQRTPVADFDADARAVLDYLSVSERVTPGALGVMGFCIGGHLAFRGAFNPDVKATVCYYGTGIHNGKLGADADAGSLARAADIQGELLLVWGSHDPHIPQDGRNKIHAALDAAGVNFRYLHYPAEHAFMRDIGPRYDPEATDAAFADMIELFRRAF